MTDALCGLWIDDDGNVHTCHVTPDGGRREAMEQFKPFAWLGSEFSHEGVRFERLKGEGAFSRLALAESLEVFDVFSRTCAMARPWTCSSPTKASGCCSSARGCMPT